jgi:hypothetical protein
MELRGKLNGDVPGFRDGAEDEEAAAWCALIEPIDIPRPAPFFLRDDDDEVVDDDDDDDEDDDDEVV